MISYLFVPVGSYAGTEVSDIITMENKAYKSHDKGIVLFTHKKHIDEYKAGCGECHHDENNKPLNNLKIGDDVQNCIECHKEPEYIKGKAAKGLSKEDKRKYHANAIHDNCKECHRAFNKKKGFKSKDKGAAPTTCKSCHPKK
ncbi:MAG: cytochrome c3 family protein [Desulfobacterales bacterium]|nr:cytochrome c3 family protein [Desulfobacteraceae bacterium]MBT4364477.1 cytochrome c3 family protein [Desulfobacteraceae bacterium]MBT7084992.1 cytochrome c3 family protein [Desulfobacterales bacterium]